MFVCGALSVALARKKPSNVSRTFSPSWRMPLGAADPPLLGRLAAGFPLDDMWHRMFGQDVTLWGPTRLLLFGGAASP